MKIERRDFFDWSIIEAAILSVINKTVDFHTQQQIRDIRAQEITLVVSDVWMSTVRIIAKEKK